MSKKVTITAYGYNELKGPAKDKASIWVNSEHFWQSDYIATAKAIRALHINIEGAIDPLQSLIETYGRDFADTCPLTGFCADCDGLGALEDALRAGDDFGDAIEKALNAVYRMCAADYEHQCTDEATADHCEANGYLFNRYGEPIHNLIKN